MQDAIQITFHSLERSPAVESAIRTEVEQLAKIHGPFTSCHATVELPHRRHRHGNHFQVRLHITGPRGEVVIGHENGHQRDHEDVYLAVRHAFAHATRKLESLVGRTRAAHSA